jgi:hypothetical protein
MTLIIQKPSGSKLVLRKELPADAEADAYIAAVEAADGQALESGVKFAIKNFVLCCKADGIWTAIKASCILAGARTLAGALVPLVGTAPTNVGGLFVSGDYNRKTGLIGNKSSKYLNSNRAANADPQDNFHASTYVSSIQSAPTGAGTALMGALSTSPTINRSLQFAADNQNDACGNRSANVLLSGRPLGSLSTGLLGTSRASSSVYAFRFNQTQLTSSQTSLSPVSFNTFIFAQNLNNGTVSAPTDARLSFYSIGESLDLALLDARVTDLINAFAAAIP